jgi:hypothetical protein
VSRFRAPEGFPWTVDPGVVVGEDFRTTMMGSAHPLLDGFGILVGVGFISRAAGRDVLVEAFPDVVRNVWRAEAWSVPATDDEGLRLLAWAAVRAEGKGREFVLDRDAAAVRGSLVSQSSPAFSVLSALTGVAEKTARRDAILAAREV